MIVSIPGGRTRSRAAVTRVAAARGPAAAQAGDQPRAAMRFALRAATTASVTVVLAALLVGVLAPQLWAAAPWLVFGVGLVLGVPHGALDHLVPWWTSARTRPRRAMAAMMAGYLTLAVLAFTVARAWPAPALAGFLLVSLLHFGAGEAAIDSLRRRRPDRPHPALRAATVLAFGATTVVIPMAARPDVANPVLQAFAPSTGALLAAGWQPACLVAVTVLDLVVAVLLAGTGRLGAAGELLLLAALFLLVPPLPAFAVYFGAWHGLRHLARLAATDPANAADLAGGRLLRPVRRLAVHAAAPTLAVTAALAAIWAVPGLADHVARGAVSAGLAVVFALTVPHLLVVAVLDRRQLRVPAPVDSHRTRH
ncbi:Brp/Blh family beta-carotene 15,15'-dioxygenase [Actinomycetospora flava]|uniref:Probable beta-carotene 15,15'-dioxygenase n=1 Tax=Actinomycetospora flava TaxID=3129232 RepID=A0ABU8MAA4_9PSEU